MASARWSSSNPSSSSVSTPPHFSPNYTQHQCHLHTPTTAPFLSHARSRLSRFRSPYLPDSPLFPLASLSHSPLPAPPRGKPTPPPSDPGVFRFITTIRRLIDEALELAVRASSTMFAVAMGSIRRAGSLKVHKIPWPLAQTLGMSPLGHPAGGRTSQCLQLNPPAASTCGVATRCGL